MTFEQRVLVTGGAGFIGSHFLNQVVPKYPRIHFTCIDKLSYAGNLDNLSPIVNESNFSFIKFDLSTRLDSLIELLKSNKPDQIINFAAESCVDRSFEDPLFFTLNNVIATQNLLEFVRLLCPSCHFIHISTDEVYGESLNAILSESSNLRPSNPYAATKASIDLILQSYVSSFKLSVTIVRGNNIYGINQYPEKIIPISIQSLINLNRKVPVHGDGHYKRTYLYIQDFNDAIELLWLQKKLGIYNVGADSQDEIDNLSLIKLIYDKINTKLGLKNFESLIDFVHDRNYNDLNYSMDSSKIKSLGWESKIRLSKGLDIIIENEFNKMNT
ncbi:putative dTDP-glucose 4,6-dehydratase [Hyphopichia burtonii NRRL Y-1933]|uniref:Putative dTDP-glucose 4,6-dehydratase n=1 Tax=Hyphopichia burtonii NRRL Y-1933 TaxID=984485 RepID=A0A1E4RDM9_9ASCO|nr:putative dTDP-glucose 4,6-dehydratase [Hyphopichia burtonii NRRL Y-1933]ODV65367.1 putative dTDP-glucose 4,6-dehydratase [Hyphopichia burtonii NRRL Y-1933]